MEQPDWRSAEDYDALKTADPANFAWEFLRRNPQYRHDYATSGDTAKSDPSADRPGADAVARRWGLRMFVDPDLDFRRVTVPWAPDAFPRQLIVGRCPPGLAGSTSAAPRVLGQAEQAGADGVLRDRGRAFHLFAFAGWPEAHPALIVPLDGDATIRLAEAQALVRLLEGLSSKPASDLLTRQRRSRLAIELRALDAALAGAPYRRIATGLFGPRHVPERAWKTHDLRSRTIRLVNTGRSRMRGTYRALLRIAPRR